jgi:hypothetical protein
VSDTKHVVLIHGSWGRGEQLASARAAFAPPKLSKATIVDFAAVTIPVLVIGAVTGPRELVQEI